MSDYIKREDAIEQARRNWTGEGEWIASTEIQLLKNLPSADVRENVRGEWIYAPIENGMIITMCSICKKCSVITPSVKEWYRFCPNCGADMRGDKS